MGARKKGLGFPLIPGKQKPDLFTNGTRKTLVSIMGSVRFQWVSVTLDEKILIHVVLFFPLKNGTAKLKPTGSVD